MLRRTQAPPLFDGLFRSIELQQAKVGKARGQGHIGGSGSIADGRDHSVGQGGTGFVSPFLKPPRC